MISSNKLSRIPTNPGVYRFLDENGTVIYVGKAKNLKKRVAQYFHKGREHNRKTEVMVSKIADIETTVVETEHEALLLENNLIKEFQPRYNILLKDGKTYPWICVKNEPFPRVFTTRSYQKDGSLYFGPYSSGVNVHNLMDLFASLFKLRSCKLSLTDENIKAGKFKPCLNHHIGRCKAPCAGLYSKEEYDMQIESVVKILGGKSSELIKLFKEKMKNAASILDFETAQEYKERVELLDKHYSKSLVVNPLLTDIDVFYLLSEPQEAFGNFLRIRAGAIIQSYNLHFKLKIEEDPVSVLSMFIAEIEIKFGKLSKEILVPFMPDNNFEGKNVHVPAKGDKMALLEMSRKNAAALKFEKLKNEEITNPDEYHDRVVINLQRDLNMKEPPVHIECFDNSNIQGTNPVSSCVVFKNAKPSKADYRHFNIKTVVGANDFASMKEVVNRRYSRILKEDGELPQLIVIDGGRGQLNFAYEALLELGISDKITIIGIAKRLEELIVPGDPYPLFLDKNSTSLKLLMNIRDEAHRFGITHHRNRRSKEQVKSQLREIPFIGEKSEEKLLKRYKSISNIKKAGYQEVASLIGERAATSLFLYWGLSS